MYSERYSLRGRQAHGRRRARRRASAWKALVISEMTGSGKGLTLLDGEEYRVLTPSAWPGIAGNGPGGPMGLVYYVLAARHAKESAPERVPGLWSSLGSGPSDERPWAVPTGVVEGRDHSRHFCSVLSCRRHCI